MSVFLRLDLSVGLDVWGEVWVGVKDRGKGRNGDYVNNGGLFGRENKKQTGGSGLKFETLLFSKSE